MAYNFPDAFTRAPNHPRLLLQFVNSKRLGNEVDLMCGCNFIPCRIGNLIQTLRFLIGRKPWQLHQQMEI